MSEQGDPATPAAPAYCGPVLLARGLRPFFLLAGIWAPLALALSVAAMQGWIALPTAFDAVGWHYHEMLFGYVAAAMAGFILTAIPNWTGRPPLRGAPLAGLALLWLGGRVAVATSEIIGAWAAAIDLSFLLALACVALSGIVAGRNWRNLPIVLAIALFLAGNALAHAEAVGLADTGALARRFAIAVVVLLIALIGGRVTPSFTRNWLAKRDSAALPPELGRFDGITLAVTALALATWCALPETDLAGGLTALAAALNLARLARWRGVATAAEPLLWALHVAYLWIPLGLALLAASQWWPAVSPTAALHALTVGAMGTMTLAVMSRAILGHTGRPLTAGPGLTAVYLLVTVAALARVFATLWSDSGAALLTIAAVAWVAAFAIFLTVCGPMLLTRRVDGGEE